MAAAGNLTRGDAGVVAGDVTQDLYRRYGRQIYAFCLRELRSPEEAEDALQTTFLNAFRGFQRGTVAHAEQAWLYKIAANVCIARRSLSARRLRLEFPNDFEALQETVAAPQGGEPVELIGLEDALESLPENQRRAILLREWQGLSYREIADELGLTQNAVEMLIFRARRTLASALEQPAEPKARTRVARGLNLGSLVGAIKTLLASGGAAKIAAAVAVVSGGTIVAGIPAEHTILHAPHASQRPSGVFVPTPPVAEAHATAAVRPQPSRPFLAGAPASPRPPAPPAGDTPPAAALAPEPGSAEPPPAPQAPAPAPAPAPVPPAATQDPAPAPAPAAPAAASPPPAKASLPPGQAKKQDAAAPSLAPGQAKKHDAAAPTLPPGQAKRQDPPVAPVASLAAIALPSAPAPPPFVPPGQAKKQDPPADPTPPPAAPAPPVAAPAVAPGNGHGKGHDK